MFLTLQQSCAGLDYDEYTSVVTLQQFCAALDYDE